VETPALPAAAAARHTTLACRPAAAWRAGEQEVGVLREQQLELSEDEKQEQEQQQQEEQLHHQAEEQEVRQQAASGGGSPQGEAGGGGDGASGQPGWRALLSGGAMASGGAAPWSLTGAAEFAAVSVAFAAGAKMLYNYYSGGERSMRIAVIFSLRCGMDAKC
jgi:hypothetical protein